MKNKAYYFLFVLYLLMFGFILYINGVFTGQITSRSNLVINISFLLLIGILMVISAISFGRLNKATDALLDAADDMKKITLPISRISGTVIKIKRMCSIIRYWMISFPNISEELLHIRLQKDLSPAYARLKII